MTPVGWQDMADLCALKGDPLVYAGMLGGVRSPVQVASELAEDTVFWAQHAAGIWIVRALDGAAVGLTGLHERGDGRGIALRFAFRPEARGRGLAREAAGAALRFAHDRARLGRVIAVARETNIGSRTVLGAIGMRECDAFLREGDRMLVYESLG
jgi:RimJ/RimL family protein N-acetyltransferase